MLRTCTQMENYSHIAFLKKKTVDGAIVFRVETWQNYNCPILRYKSRKGKGNGKKRTNEKISRKIQTKVDNCTEDRLNFYAEDRTRNRKRKRNADPSAQNSKRIDPCPRVRDSLFVRRYCTAKSFSLPRFNQLDFERSCRHVDAITRNFSILHPIIR